MRHEDHVDLLRGAITQRQGGRWADLGSGEGAFTLAVRELLGDEGEIFSIDLDRGKLDSQRRKFREAFPQSKIHFIHADFTKPIDLPPLDGLIMANSLHYVRDKIPLVTRLVNCLRPGGTFLLVEYNVDNGNMWVPYPISFASWRQLAPCCRLSTPSLIARIPSRFLKEIYSASARSPLG